MGTVEAEVASREQAAKTRKMSNLPGTVLAASSRIHGFGRSPGRGGVWGTASRRRDRAVTGARFRESQDLEWLDGSEAKDRVEWMEPKVAEREAERWVTEVFAG